METNIKNIAAFIAAAVWADGEYNDAEKDDVKEIGEALELDKLVESVEAEIEAIKDLDGQAVSDYLIKNAEGIADDDIAAVFESVLQILFADGVFTYAEAQNLLVMADALGIEHEYALLMVADLIREDSDIEIEFSEE